MIYGLAVIDQLLERHQALQKGLKSLEETCLYRFPSQLEELAEAEKLLKRLMSFLEESLYSHFAYEEEVLQPWLDELFMRTFQLDHREIESEINEVKSMATRERLQGLSRERLQFLISYIHGRVVVTYRMVEDHTAKEGVILRMVRRALQEKEQKKG